MANNDNNATPIGAHEPALVETTLLQNLLSQETKAGSAEDVVATQSAKATAPTPDNSQLTTDGHGLVFTPPAVEEFSSQTTTQDGGPLSQLSQLSQLAAAQLPLESSTTITPTKVNVTLNASQKRTADGHVKPKTSNSSSNSPSPKALPPVRSHTRNTSTVSNVSSVASRLGELSSELRTRLSYAMVKVNNGWESKSINEVETIASQAGSPTSSNSTFNTRRNFLTSPRAAIANIQGQGSTDVFGPRPTADFDLYARTEPPSRTYESFWRDHSTANGAHSYRHNLYSSSYPQSKSLAPPADIRPTASSRRSDSKFSKPPSMPGQPSANSHHSFNINSAPRTPNATAYNRPEHAMTSVNKTIQEQDAIATLLSMGSPGNSQSMGPTLTPPHGSQTSPRNSPLRAEFSLQRAQNGKGKVGPQSQRRVEFAESVSSGGSENGYPAASHRKSAMRNNQNGRRITDKMLDEMVDESSDEEVELPVPQGRRIPERV
ncbi:ec1f51bf-e8b8-465c-9bf4-00bed59b972a [Sclerotinia trifoliorum]|uniref:Ec1f51bf-e8b8-465c-9bf4-00bed59b972a n=1 Tax=Sclerotinia trifoliorum TaxID=28548 RepID=A0A8H2ZN87_9HELO|nr:ec1f51bf-e8b8-465c-9bf4-00bed59b972a [Sclerotinia trifoliorum]